MRRLLMLVALTLLFLGRDVPSGAQSAVKDLDAAVAALKSSDPANRAAGMSFMALLGADGKAYSREVVTGLFDSNADVRMWAAKGLPLINPTLAGPVLALVQSNDYDKRLAAVQQLAKLGETGAAAMPALLAFLKDAKSSDRVNVVKSLTDVGAKDPALVSILVNMAIKDADPAVRQAALKGLPKLANSEAVAEAFGSFLKDSDPSKRSAAINAIGNLDKSNPAILKVLKSAMNDPSPTVRDSAKKALEKLQPPKKP